MKEDKRWIPVLKGKQYCSPACGFGCTKKDYDSAINKSNDLCKELGKNWTSEVWENGKWNYAVILQLNDDIYIKIYEKSGGTFWLDSRLPGQVYTTTKNMKEGINSILKEAEEYAELTLKNITQLKEKL